MVNYVLHDIGKPPNREGIEKKLRNEDQHVCSDCIRTIE